MAATDNSEDVIIPKFEQTLSEMKAPLLDKTDEAMNNSGNQDIDDVLHTVGGRLDELHNTIKGIIDNNGQLQAGGTLNVNSVYQLLEQRGICSALRANPALKEPMMTSLRLYLKEYPFTRSRAHVQRLHTQHVPSQLKIIPNIM